MRVTPHQKCKQFGHAEWRLPSNCHCRWQELLFPVELKLLFHFREQVPASASERAGLNPGADLPVLVRQRVVFTQEFNCRMELD